MNKPTLSLGFADTFSTAVNFFTHVLGQRYTILRNDENPDYLIFGDSNFGQTHWQRKAKKKIFYTGENCRPNYFTYDHAITFDHENSPMHYRLPLYVPEMMQRVFTGWTDDYLWLVNERPETDWEKEYDLKKGFCSFVVSNPKNQVRVDFFKFLDQKKRVDSGGPVLNNIGYVLPRDRDSKNDFIRSRKFNIAFENGSHPGYCTEKILEAFYACTIPIYFGSVTVSRDFNSKAFINCHDYRSFDEVVERMFELEADKNKYLDVLSQPVFANNIPPATTDLDEFVKWFERFVMEK